MAKSRTNLVNRALEKLLVVGAGQTADSEDVEKVDAIVTSVLEALSADQIYTVADEDDIEESAFEWIAEVLAVASASDFGQAPDFARREYAEKRLVRLTASRPSKEPLAVDYF
jgi:hypothetical protein